MSNSTPGNSMRMLLLICVLATTTHISAQPIGVWSFTGNTNGNAGPFNTVSAASFSGVASTAFNAGNEFYGQNNWPGSTSPNTSVYFQFSLTPATGYSLNISTIVLRMRRSNTGVPAGSGPRSWAIRSSLDGFTTNIASGTVTHNYANYTITPGFSFGTLTSGVTFRVYGYNASVGVGGNSRLVFDNVEVNGLGNPLPVHIISFGAKQDGSGIRVRYELGQADPGDQYLVERSVDGVLFATINERLQSALRDYESYDFLDDALPRGTYKLFYRLAIRTASGHLRYSNVAIVSLVSNDAGFTANIAGNLLRLTGIVNPSSHVSIVSSAGIQVFRTRLATSFANGPGIPIPKLAPGVYFVSVMDSNGRRTVSMRVD